MRKTKFDHLFCDFCGQTLDEESNLNFCVSCSIEAYKYEERGYKEFEEYVLKKDVVDKYMTGSPSINRIKAG